MRKALLTGSALGVLIAGGVAKVKRIRAIRDGYNVTRQEFQLASRCKKGREVRSRPQDSASAESSVQAVTACGADAAWRSPGRARPTPAWRRTCRRSPRR